MKLIDKSYMLLMCASALAAALALTACSADGDDDVRAGGDTMAYVSVSLSVAQPGGTRSPQGGDDGDGREPGVNHENDIDNVTLLLYRAENGVNAENAGGVIIEKAIYFPSLTSTPYGTYTSAPRECKIDISAGYHAIVVANMGDVSSEFQGQPLSSVRDHIVEKAWTEAADVSGYTGFAMASAEDATLSPTGNDGDGSEANPYVIQTSIERVAARIDIEPGDGEWDGGASTYTYKILSEDGQSDTGDRFVLTHVMPFNLMNAGSYLLKRVCDGQGGNISYLGEETKDNEQQNWEHQEMRLKQFIIDADSPFLDKSIRHSGIRNQYNCLIVGIEKADGTLMSPDADEVLHQGEVIWVVGEEIDVAHLLDKTKEKANEQ